MLGSRPGLVTNNFQIPDTLYLGSSPAIVETELTPISSSFIAEFDSPHGGWKGRTSSWVNFLLFHLNFLVLLFINHHIPRQEIQQSGYLETFIRGIP